MGIYDREYVRQHPSRGRPPPGAVGVSRFRMVSVNTWLIIINVFVFLLQSQLPVQVSNQGLQGDPLFLFGHFSTFEGFQRMEVWRLVTFQFLHANFMHLFFNMLGLWIFGSLVEQYLGSRKFLAYYLVCGIFGGLTYLLLNLLGTLGGISFPGVLPNHTYTPLVGASAGVFGVIVACAFISPNTIVQLIFPPIPLKMRTMAYGYVGLALFNLLMGGSNAGGDAAHVGGAVAGYFFIRNPHLLTDFFDFLNDSRKQDKRPGKGQRARGGPSDKDVNRVLDKVRESGLHSLTDREKAVLREASRAKSA
ncbi:MAG: rhomboid family intramembrane serine protease [Phycisphaerales bacterium]